MKFIKLQLGYGQMNCYILYDEITKETAIIDPGYDFEIINDFIKENELTPKYILLTHSHGDHIGAVSQLKDKYQDLKLGIHEMEVKMLFNPELNLSNMIQPKAISLKPDFTFKDKDTIFLGDEKIDIIHTPGHSPGGSCFKIKDNIFVGDTIFNMSIGRTDFYMGDHTVLINSILNKILTEDKNTVLHPGHGPETKVGFELERNPYI